MTDSAATPPASAPAASSSTPPDRSDPEGAIAAAAARCSTWGRWGPDDVRGTANFIDEECRRRAAALVRRGATFSLAQSFDEHGRGPVGRRTVVLNLGARFPFELKTRNGLPEQVVIFPRPRWDGRARKTSLVGKELEDVI